MAEEKEVVVEETQVETAETTPQETVETENETASEENACTDKKENACEDKKENAAVYVTETYTERFDTSMYDTETGKDAYQSVEVRTSVSDRVDGNIVDTNDGVKIAEGEESGAETPAETPVETPPEEPVETPVETPVEEPVVEPVAEQAAEQPEVVVQPGDEVKNIAETLTALAEAVKNLTAEVQEMKEAQKKHATASQTFTAENINPFIDSMSANGQKYSLLEADAPASSYSLLSE